MNRADLRV